MRVAGTVKGLGHHDGQGPTPGYQELHREHERTSSMSYGNVLTGRAARLLAMALMRRFWSILAKFLDPGPCCEMTIDLEGTTAQPVPLAGAA